MADTRMTTYRPQFRVWVIQASDAETFARQLESAMNETAAMTNDPLSLALSGTFPTASGFVAVIVCRDHDALVLDDNDALSDLMPESL
jgi:hypothetical protein